MSKTLSSSIKSFSQSAVISPISTKNVLVVVALVVGSLLFTDCTAMCAAEVPGVPAVPNFSAAPGKRLFESLTPTEIDRIDAELTLREKKNVHKKEFLLWLSTPFYSFRGSPLRGSLLLATHFGFLAYYARFIATGLTPRREEPAPRTRRQRFEEAIRRFKVYREPPLRDGRRIQVGPKTVDPQVYAWNNRKFYVSSAVTLTPLLFYPRVDFTFDRRYPSNAEASVLIESVDWEAWAAKLRWEAAKELKVLVKEPTYLSVGLWVGVISVFLVLRVITGVGTLILNFGCIL